MDAVPRDRDPHELHHGIVQGIGVAVEENELRVREQVKEQLNFSGVVLVFEHELFSVLLQGDLL